MPDFRLGVIIVLIAAFGYFSNFLNGRYLNYGPVRFLYYLGAVVHETSHAILCVLTGAKIEEFRIFSDQPRVVHRKSRLPIAGELLISIAPIAGGLLFLFLVNHYLLGSYFTLPSFPRAAGWYGLLVEPVRLLSQLDFLQWQSWLMIFLSLNAGAMLGPSPQDLKNSWLALAILFFVASPALNGLGLAALSLIMANIAIQAVVIIILKTISLARR